MKTHIVIGLIVFSIFFLGCSSEQKNDITEKSTELKIENESVHSSDTLTKHLKAFDADLPTIGLLMYNGVLQSEVIAASDVFSKPNEEGKQLFNVITTAEFKHAITTEDGMHFVPDYTFETCPKLIFLNQKTAYDMYAQVHNEKLIDFIKRKNQETEYIVSNCGGAQLIGKSGIADGHKIVTWIGGGVELQKDYPNLIVQNDSLITFVEDGKFSSSNGNLASYISALNLLEKMTSSEQRKFVESYLYLDRLQNWRE